MSGQHPQFLPPSAPRILVDALISAGLVTPSCDWTPLPGGRTNSVWRIQTGDTVLVCKLYRPDTETPLFPNAPEAEARALRFLDGTGFAPRFRHSGSTSLGQVVVYDYLEGEPAPRDPAKVGNLLSRLHGLAPPPGLRQLESGAAAILNQGDMMLRNLSGTAARELRALRPSAVETGPVTPRFLHGDPVPANIVATPGGLRLIDWQCPALGDPVNDLALVLSPAMQHLYGGKPLTDHETDRFLHAYSHQERTVRLRTLLPAFHWRMAAYCLWKADRGDADYLEGFALEKGRL